MKRYVARALCIISITGIMVALASPACMAQGKSDKNYVVGPGDVLDIRVWDNDDLNRTVEVSQEGSFSFPFIGSIRASKRSVFQIEQLLIKKLSDGYLVSPQVNVSMAEYRNQKVFLFGEVNKPGSYVLKHRNHLLELISEAGGFTDQRGTTCTIVRPEAGADKNLPTSIHNAKKSEIIRVNLDRLTSGGSGAPPLYIKPGDSIYIGESEKIFVTGEVRMPGKIKWENGMTVREAVSLAGGGTPRASVNRIRIIRNENGTERTIRPNLADPVRPNDIIKVPESFF